VNFLAQMSWSPGKERIYSMDEMIERFYLDKRSRGHPILDLEKLEWLNGQLISQMKPQELFPYVKQELKKSGLWEDELENEKRKWFINLIILLKPRSRRISDFTPRARPFLSDNYTIEEGALEKYLKDRRLPQLLPKLNQDFSECDDFSAQKIEQIVRERADKEGVKAALFIHALRVIVLGMKVSPGIFDVLELVGKERTIQRLSTYLSNP